MTADLKNSDKAKRTGVRVGDGDPPRIEQWRSGFRWLCRPSKGECMPDRERLLARSGREIKISSGIVDTVVGNKDMIALRFDQSATANFMTLPVVDTESRIAEIGREYGGVLIALQEELKRRD